MQTSHYTQIYTACKLKEKKAINAHKHMYTRSENSQGKKESGIAATLGKFLLCEDWERPHVKLVTYAPP